MVNTAKLPGTDLTSSVLGMGCASLGSRIARADGLRALAAAHDQGISWFDVAPAYGAGEAEPIVGEFARGRRDRMIICSKVGVLPPQHNGVMRFAYTFGRPLLGLVKGARGRFRKVKATRNQTVALTPEFINTSIEATLRRIGLDHIDVLALHKASPEDIVREEIVRTLEALLQSGKARYISVASSEDAAAAALRFPETYAILQLADNPTTRPLPRLRELAPRLPAFVTHSVFGVDGAKDYFIARLKQDRVMHARLVAAGYTGGDEQMIADLLLDRGLASNPDGVVLTSMFSARHLAANVARASRPVVPAALDLVEAMVAADKQLASVI
jgi:aryl-alcohol dehydrogenase-like predicted oxidoreductase